MSVGVVELDREIGLANRKYQDLQNLVQVVVHFFRRDGRWYWLIKWLLAFPAINNQLYRPLKIHYCSTSTMLCWLSCSSSDACMYVIVCAYPCNWVMSCIYTEGACSSHRLSSEGRTSTAAFSAQGSTSPSAGTQYCTYLYSSCSNKWNPVLAK